MDESELKPARNRRRRWALPLALVVIVLLGAFGVQRWRYASVHESTNDAFVGGRLVPMLTKVGGFVREVRVAENDMVEGGEVVVTLDDRELRQQLTRAEADLTEARIAAGWQGLEGQASSRVDEAMGRREALTAQIAAARAEAERAARDVERIQGLAEREIISRQQLDAAQVGAEAARAAVASLEQQRAAADAAIRTARAGVGGAEARLEAAKATVEAARLQLSYVQVEVPVGGSVARLSVSEGQLVQPGQPLFTLVPDSGAYIDANFKETQLAAIRKGEPVDVEVDAYRGCEARGEVQGVGGATGSQFALIPPDNATGNFTKVVQRVPVRIRITEGCGPDRPLLPGMSVVVDVETG